LKLPAPAGNAPAEPSAPAPEAPLDNTQNQPAPLDDKPFDDEPFDAGVEADEATDPKKFIEQLTGKLGQSLRKYTEEQGQPDFDLEKFAINSVLSATHTAEMDDEDKNDIIKKVNTAGDDGSENSDLGNDTNEPNNGNDNNDGNNDDNDMSFDSNDEADLEEVKILEDKTVNSDNLFITPKKNSMFAPEGSPEFMEQNRITESCWDGYKQVGMKEKGGKQVPNCVPINENLTKPEKMIILDKNALKAKLQETFNQEDMTQPAVEPVTKPTTKPSTEPSKPSRRDNPFRIEPDTIPQPDPKALNEGKWFDMMKGVRKQNVGPWSLVASNNNKVIGQDIDIKIQDAIPAHYEQLKRQFPNAVIYLENGEGLVVWSDKNYR
jgi:hypothetical protein